MESQGKLEPREARDAAEFVALMRQLKEKLGLTYRQLEERAAERGEVLARSTLAASLRSDALPREETLAVFLRACGQGHQAEAWMESRDRIAAGRSQASDAAMATSGLKYEPDLTGNPETRRPDVGRFTSSWRSRSLRLAGVGGAAVGVTLTIAIGMAYVPDRTSHAAPPLPGRGNPTGTVTTNCLSETCKWKDPKQYQCVHDAEEPASVKTEYGLISLYYSAACKALWGEIFSFEEKEIVSVFLKSDQGDVLSLKSNNLTEEAKSVRRQTPMLPSEQRPRHSEVCVAYRKLEACVDSDGFSRVKPYPSTS